jgi:hypothetical protein
MSFLFLAKASIMPAGSKPATKKSSIKKISKRSESKGEVKIKYSDKSPGQPELIPIFEEIKKMLVAYEKGTIKLSGGSDGKVALISKQPVEILGRKRHELWFAGAYRKGMLDFIMCRCTPIRP